jgi:PAS domain S-box-containing protein
MTNEVANCIVDKKDNQFQVFFQYATMGILVCNAAGEIVAVNPFALTLFGYTEAELLQQKVELLIPPRFGETHVHHREQFNVSPKNRVMGEGMGLYGLRKDGTEFPVEISLGNYATAGERFVIAYISDITLRKKQQDKIDRLNNELEATVEQRTKELKATMQELEKSKEELSHLLKKEKALGELKSRFVSMASHEFRTPLSTILSSAYLVDKYKTAEEHPKREKHLQRIISSVNMLTDILNDFLSEGKIEEGKITVRFSTFGIVVATDTIIQQLNTSLKAGQTFDYRHEGEETVVLDISLYKHILLNLMSNAIKFSPDGSVIVIRTHAGNGHIELRVSDSGIGISKEDQQHLMERFFRGANAINIQGTGLGLHIVSKYAELMHGRIQCESELEKGTTFTVNFKPRSDEPVV